MNEKYIDEIFSNGYLDDDKILDLLKNHKEQNKYLFKKSRQLQKEYYGNKVIARGLIEFTNYCKNNCFYCGIRKDNKTLTRYRLTKEDILACCEKGFKMGLKSFVLQGGEDSFYTKDQISDIVSSIKRSYPKTAVTLSLGEHDKQTYKMWFDSGADRYLLKHETKNAKHYNKLHPKSMSLQQRIRCLYYLKDIGYQVGTGFMVCSPYQTYENILEDLKFIYDFKPHMVGIGPYIPHKNTPFKNMPEGSVSLTLTLIAIIRLMLPKTLIPATTAVASLRDSGRINAVLAGANVIMPNLTPIDIRKHYSIYNNKLYLGNEDAKNISILKKQMKNIGYELSFERGDSKLNN